MCILSRALANLATRIHRFRALASFNKRGFSKRLNKSCLGCHTLNGHWLRNSGAEDHSSAPTRNGPPFLRFFGKSKKGARRVLHKSSTLKGSRRYDDDPHTSRSNFPRYSAMSHHNTDRGGNAQSISASISGVCMCANNFFRDFFSVKHASYVYDVTAQN